MVYLYKKNSSEKKSRVYTLSVLVHNLEEYF